MKAKINMTSKLLLASTVGILAGCAATQTALEHGTLQVSTRQSDTIFLDPVSNNKKTIYVAVKNTSDQDLEIAPQLKIALKEHGYKVVSHPDGAHYLLQANIRKVGKMSIAATHSALGSGYGSAIAGAVTGTALGSISNSGTGMIAGGLAGGVIGLAADSLVKDVNYTMITDVQISERIGKGAVQEHFNSTLQNGSASGSTQTSSKQGDYKHYRIRVVSNADKVNLSFAQARPALEQGLVKNLAGNF